MSTCSHCGMPIVSPEAVYCGYCGERLEHIDADEELSADDACAQDEAGDEIAAPREAEEEAADTAQDEPDVSQDIRPESEDGSNVEATPEPESSVDPEPESEVEPEAEAEAEAQVEPEAESEIEPEAESLTETKAGSEPGATPESDPATEDDAQADSEPTQESETEGETEAENQPEHETETEPAASHSEDESTPQDKDDTTSPKQGEDANASTSEEDSEDETSNGATEDDSEDDEDDGYTTMAPATPATPERKSGLIVGLIGGGVAVVAVGLMFLLAFLSTPASSYQVKFETTGGAPIEPIRATQDEPVSAPTMPTRHGYSFVGWYEDSDLTMPANFPLELTGDVVLYAKWEEDSENALTGSLPTAPQSSTTSEAAASSDTSTSETPTATVHKDGAPFYGVWIGRFRNFENATAFQQQARAAGVDAQILMTTDWANLNPKDYYVITAGMYDDEASAQAALPGAKAAGYDGAYIKYSGAFIPPF